MPGRLLSTTEAAALLGVTAEQVRHYCATGQLPAQRVGERAWAIETRTVERFQRRPVGRPAVRRGRPRKAEQR